MFLEFGEHKVRRNPQVSGAKIPIGSNIIILKRRFLYGSDNHRLCAHQKEYLQCS